MLNSELQVLHARLAMGDMSAQLEIDRRIYACVAAENGWTQHQRYARIPLAWLYTERWDTPQYLRLPDLLRFLTQGMTKQSWTENTFETLIHNSLPCLKRGRMLHNPIENAPASTITVCINVMYGTLMGLFPTCAKYPTFSVRKEIYMALRALASSPVVTARKFLLAVPNLLKLSVMEYIVNSSKDFCPSEISYYMSIKGMDTYYSVCANICDSLRTEVLQTDDWTWQRLDQHATLLVERFTRTCKFRAYKAEPSQSDVMSKVLSKWRKSVQTVDTGVLCSSLSSHFSSIPNTLRVLLDTGQEVDTSTDTHTDRNTFPCIIESIQYNMMCYPLPSGILQGLYSVAVKRYEQNPHASYMASKLHICTWCINKPSSNPLNQRLRLNVDTNTFSCSVCQSHAPVVCVNLLGRILRVGVNYYYLCQCCMRIQRWTSSGTELTSQQCTHTLTTKRNKKGRTDGAERHQATRTDMEQHNATECGSFQQSMSRNLDAQCAVCSTPTVVQYINTLHVPSRCFAKLFLCKRHRIQQHLLPFIYDTHTLKQILLSANNTAALHRYY